MSSSSSPPAKDEIDPLPPGGDADADADDDDDDIDVNEPLSDDDDDDDEDDDDDDDDEDDEDDDAGDVDDEIAHVLSMRTGQLMDTFRDYVASMTDGVVAGGGGGGGVGGGGGAADDDDDLERGMTAAESPASGLAGDDDLDPDLDVKVDVANVDDCPRANVDVGGEGRGGDVVHGMMLRDFRIGGSDDGDDPTDDFDRDADMAIAWLGGDDDGKRGRGRYAKSFLRSKRARRGALMIASFAVLVGGIVGIARVRWTNNLPDWEGMLREQEEGSKEEKGREQAGGTLNFGDDGHTDHASVVEPGAGVGGVPSYQDHPTTAETAVATEEESAASTIISDVLANSQAHSTVHDPAVTSSSSSASSASSSASSSSSSSSASASSSSSSSSSNSAATGTDWQEHHYYVQMAEKHHPEWFSRGANNYPGTDRQWAMKYCESVERDERMVLCPYEAYCPGGPGNVPAGGHYKDGEGHVQWSPISDTPDVWVQVSSDGGNGCAPGGGYQHGGNASGGYEAETRYVLCCRDLAAVEAGAATSSSSSSSTTASTSSSSSSSSTAASTSSSSSSSTVASTSSSSSSSSTVASTSSSVAPAAEEYQQAERHEPKWYDRSSGWEGRTYEESAVFCKQKHAGGSGALCPYNVVCPLGPHHIPYGGLEEDDITGSLVQWVALSKPYNDWAMVGPGPNICGTYTNINDESPTWGLTGDEYSEGMTEFIICCREMTTIEEYEPAWYDRSSGWDGRTYDDASSFCALNHAGGFGALCPYEAVCPAGPRNAPYEGVFEEYDANGMNNASLVQWTPLSDSYNDWVMVGPNVDVCLTYMNVHYESPTWGLTGENSDDITETVICCRKIMTSADYESDSVTSVDSTLPQTSDQNVHIEEASSSQILFFAPVAYDRSSGWMGQNYLDALKFCASKDSKILCPHEVICSNIETILGEVEAGWVPIIDSPNGWARVGHASGTCMTYNDLESHPPQWGLTGEQNEAITRNILCCAEPEGFGPEVDGEISHAVVLNAAEQVILNTMHPVWFGRHDGYHGTTYEEAELFCRTIGDMHLCPAAAYCPNGLSSDKPLYLQKDPFEGEQWAPLTSYDSEEVDMANTWIMVGTLNGDSSSTCQKYEDLNNGNSPSWTVDDSHSGLKEHILCCMNQSLVLAEESITREFNSIWLDQSHGWHGGSYSEGEQFCAGLGGKKLCPYAVYCPHGPGHNPMGGHSVDFNLEGEQWAPVLDKDNEWVLIGRKYGNVATTCFLHNDLEGSLPDWGLTGDNSGAKLHIQCCNV